MTEDAGAPSPKSDSEGMPMRVQPSKPSSLQRPAARSLTSHLAQYAAYHRDPRNILTHLAGIPVIVAAVLILAARPTYALGGLPLSPATLLALGAGVFYLRLDLRLGAVMAALLAGGVWLGAVVAAWPTPEWLGTGVGLFVAGWAVQFVGHFYEGRKPAFTDDVMGLAIGPLFIVAEAAFFLGLRADLRRAVEAQAGPLAWRNRASR